MGIERSPEIRRKLRRARRENRHGGRKLSAEQLDRTFRDIEQRFQAMRAAGIEPVLVRIVDPVHELPEGWGAPMRD